MYFIVYLRVFVQLVFKAFVNVILYFSSYHQSTNLSTIRFNTYNTFKHRSERFYAVISNETWDLSISMPFTCKPVISFKFKHLLISFVNLLTLIFVSNTRYLLPDVFTDCLICYNCYRLQNNCHKTGRGKKITASSAT